jgi:hypothetical protein
MKTFLLSFFRIHLKRIKKIVNSNPRIYVGIVLVLFLFLSNQVFTSVQLNSLLTNVKKSEFVMEDFVSKMIQGPTEENDDYLWTDWQGKIQEGTRTVLVYKNPSGEEIRFNDREEAWGAWRKDMSQIASISKDNLVETTFDIEQTLIFPWKSDLKLARDKYLDHHEAWIEYIDAFAQMKENSDILSNFDKDFAISPTFKISEKAFLRSVPVIDLLNSKKKIETIFAE